MKEDVRLLSIKVPTKESWDTVQNKLLNHNVHWLNNSKYVSFPREMASSSGCINIYVYSDTLYGNGIHMTYGSHDPGISEEEFMQLDLIEFLF